MRQMCSEYFTKNSIGILIVAVTRRMTGVETFFTSIARECHTVCGASMQNGVAVVHWQKDLFIFGA